MKFKIFKSSQFCLAYRKLNQKFLFEDENMLGEFEIVKNPLFYWLADPFVVEISGKNFIFAEALNRLTYKGKLVYAEISGKIKWKTLLNKRYHLSFPNIYKEDDKFFLIPETSKNNSIDLYKIEFKNNTLICNFIKTLVKDENKNVDTVLLNNFMCTYSIRTDPICFFDVYEKINNTYIKIFSCEDKTFKMRSAGQIFQCDNKIIYPTQDCSIRYGGGIIFNFINKNTFKLEPFKIIDFNKVNLLLNTKNLYKGIHTYNKNESYEVIDLQKINFNVLSFIGKFVLLFKRIFKK